MNMKIGLREDHLSRAKQPPHNRTKMARRRPATQWESIMRVTSRENSRSDPQPL